MSIQNLLCTHMSPVGVWLSNLKYGGDFRSTNELGKEPRLKYINVLRIENLQFPNDLDSYKTQIKLRFSVTLYNSRTEKFISNTYLSPFLPVFVNEIINFEDFEDEEEDNKSEQKNMPKSALSNKNNGNYQHAGFWVAFIVDKDDYIKDYKLAIETIIYQYDNLEKKMERSKTLGYSMIDLETKLKTASIYSGSVRETLQGYYLREQKILPQYLAFEMKRSNRVMDLLLKLVGPYMLFGMEDKVYGMKQQQMPINLKDIINLEFDNALDVKFPKITFKFNRIVEIDLMDYILEQQRKESGIQEVKVTKSDQYGIIVCHNGWKAVNQSEYNNTFKIETESENSKQIICTTLREQRVDRIFPNTIIVIQVIFKYEVEIAEVKKEYSYYIGYTAITPKWLTKFSSKISLNMIGNRPIFDEKAQYQYFVKYSPKYIAEIEIEYIQAALAGSDNPFVNKDKDDQETILMKNQIIQMAKRTDKEATFKENLINQSNKKKLEIKTGLAKDETIQRYNKLINDIIEIRDNTSTICVDMIKKGNKAQEDVQRLLIDFQDFLDIGNKNFDMAKEKYLYKEKKLMEYQERKLRLDEIQNERQQQTQRQQK